MIHPQSAQKDSTADYADYADFFFSCAPDRGMDMFSGRQVKAAESLDWQQIGARDAERKKAVRSLLASGQVKSGREYQFAALVFQHSSDPADLHTAHVLATTAVAKGHQQARWLAAASFDRLLWNLNRPQVDSNRFGGLFRSQNAPWPGACRAVSFAP